MKVSDIKTPVGAITGVGPTLTKLLAKLNIFTVGDLLTYYPRTYEDRTKRISLCEYNQHPKVHTVAKVINQEWFGYGRMRTLKIRIDDGTATAELIAFNRAFLEKVLVPGSFISVTGQFYVKYNTLQSSSFDAAPLQFEQGQEPDERTLRTLTPPDSGIIPVYPLTEGLTQKNLSKAINTAIQQYLHGIEDELPLDIMENRKLLPKQTALKLIHQPETVEMAQKARTTLAYEELFHFQYIISERAYKRRGFLPAATLEKQLLQNEQASAGGDSSPAPSDYDFSTALSPHQKDLLNQLPFSLTDDQKKVILQMDREIDLGYEQRNKIMNSIANGEPVASSSAATMARLLQGDVGSGKTLTALFVCLRVIDYGGQCVFMAPTEILARQHADTISRLVGKFGIQVAFLTGNVKASGRTQLLKALKEGDINIAVGTHALFSSQVVYKDLQLAVIDEQHRFGVLQRQAILEKGRVYEKNAATFEPHLLMMSATPIPQTLALTVFGDLDVSTIKTLPAGRKPIQTFLVKEGNEQNAYTAVYKELKKGHQAYFVYPAIDSTELKSAEHNFEMLKQMFKEFNCALVHSKIPEEEQTKCLNDFHDGKIQLLCATTVIEVGVDVPNATIMVIEQADRFGMAQLHQLRGRVGRSSEQSYCVLIYSKNITDTGIERMKALRQSTDGFYIAEQDLKTRGPGEVTGTLQAGQLEFAVADLSVDQPLMLQARVDAIGELAKQGISN